MRRSSAVDISEVVSLLMTIVGLIAIGVILLVIVRMQRGLLGIVLGGLAVALFIYWIFQFRKIMGKELPSIPSRRTWNYEIMHNRNEITIVADVPGPEDKVDVRLIDRILHIRGGKNFKREVQIPDNVTIAYISYVNGVLQVKLKRAADISDREADGNPSDKDMPEV